MKKQAVVTPKIVITARRQTQSEELALAAARVKAHLVNSLAGEFYASRLNQHKSEAEIAELMGYSQARVSAFERAEVNPTLDTIAHMSAALGLEIEVVVKPASTLES